MLCLCNELSKTLQMASKFRIPAIIMPITISIGTQPSVWVVFSFVTKDSGILEISADNSGHQ